MLFFMMAFEAARVACGKAERIFELLGVETQQQSCCDCRAHRVADARGKLRARVVMPEHADKAPGHLAAEGQRPNELLPRGAHVLSDGHHGRNDHRSKVPRTFLSRGVALVAVA